MPSNFASMTMKYVPNLPAIEAAADLYGTQGVALAVPAIEERAKAIAPVETGAYRDSIYGEVLGPVGRVGSDIRYAFYIEFGTSDTPTFAVLRRASDGEVF